MEDTPGATFIGIGIGGIIIAVVFIVLAIIMGIVIGVSTDQQAVQEPDTSVPADLDIEATAEVTEAEDVGESDAQIGAGDETDEAEIEEATAEVTEAAAAGGVAVSVTPSPTKETFDN